MSSAHSPTVSPPVQRSLWHSPVPYLFGGLAAMLGLIAFALLILACSYWKLSGYLDNDENMDSNRDVELGDVKSEEKQKAPLAYKEKILVIMAGQPLPTHLATPSTCRDLSFGSNCGNSDKGKSSEEPEGNRKQGNNDRVQKSTLETHETGDRNP